MHDRSAYPRSRWNDEVSDVLLGIAVEDARADGLVRPALAAYRDGREVLLAWLRPFEKGDYEDPIIEVVALAVPLGANQLAVLMGARAWSLEDPVAPVADGVDLRQRVAMVTAADGSRSPVVTATALQPYDLGPHGEVRLQEQVQLGAGQGWLSEALSVFVRHRPDNRLTTSQQLARQAERVVDLGHGLCLHPDSARRLGRVPGRRRPR